MPISPDDKRIRLNFIFRAQPEGLGTIVIATIYMGRRRLWGDAVWIPEPGEEVAATFWANAPAVMDISAAEVRRGKQIMLAQTEGVRA